MVREKPSLDATKKFIDLIHQYRDQFHYSGDSLFVGPIGVGTPESPSVVVPIEMDPGEMRHRLESTRDILSEAIRRARESARLTGEAIKELDTSSPEADERIKFMEDMANRLDTVLNSFRGFAWHPKCYIEIEKLVQDRFVPGDPKIRILVEFWV